MICHDDFLFHFFASDKFFNDKRNLLFLSRRAALTVLATADWIVTTFDYGGMWQVDGWWIIVNVFVLCHNQFANKLIYLIRKPETELTILPKYMSRDWGLLQFHSFNTWSMFFLNGTMVLLWVGKVYPIRSRTAQANLIERTKMSQPIFKKFECPLAMCDRSSQAGSWRTTGEAALGARLLSASSIFYH